MFVLYGNYYYYNSGLLLLLESYHGPWPVVDAMEITDAESDEELQLPTKFEHFDVSIVA